MPRYDPFFFFFCGATKRQELLGEVKTGVCETEGFGCCMKECSDATVH